jgi:hypothetical protein
MWTYVILDANVLDEGTASVFRSFTVKMEASGFSKMLVPA